MQRYSFALPQPFQPYGLVKRCHSREEIYTEYHTLHTTAVGGTFKGWLWVTATAQLILGSAAQRSDHFGIRYSSHTCAGV